MKEIQFVFLLFCILPFVRLFNAERTNKPRQMTLDLKILHFFGRLSFGKKKGKKMKEI